MRSGTVLMLAIGFLFTSTSWGTEPNAEAAKALADIRRLDGNVTLDEKSLDRPVVAVNLIYTAAGDADLRRIAVLNQLRELRLSGTQVTDAGLECLQGLTQLETLTLHCTNVSDAGLKHIAGLSQLRCLGLRDTKITNAGVEHVAGLTGLLKLDIQGTKITDAGLEHLEKLTRLETLNLRDTHLSDAGLKHLKTLRELMELTLGDTHCTEAAIEDLGKTLSGCEIFAYPIRKPEPPPPPSAAPSATVPPTFSWRFPIIYPWQRQPDVARLCEERFGFDIEGDKDGPTLLTNDRIAEHATPPTVRVTDRDLACLEKWSTLLHVTIWGDDLTAALIEHLRPCKKLESLHLCIRDRRGFDGRDLEPLTDMRNLRYLNLAGPRISLDAMRHIGQLKSLWELSLGGPAVTDEGLVYLGGLKRLRRLSLTGTGVTGKGMKHLVPLKALQTLYFDPPVRETEVRELARSLPGLEIWGQMWRVPPGDEERCRRLPPRIAGTHRSWYVFCTITVGWGSRCCLKRTTSVGCSLPNRHPVSVE